MSIIRYTKSNYDGKSDKLIIYAIGDLHVGHTKFNEGILKETLKEIKDNKEVSRILLMGDLLECATKTSIGAGLFETNLTPEEQQMYIEEIFEPFKDIIDGVVIGNHEDRIYQSTSIDVIRSFCKSLGIPYLKYNGIVNYAWNKKAYTVNMWHGAGGGGTIGSALNKCVKMSEKTFADVYLMGHVHKLADTTRRIKLPDTRNNKLVDIKQTFVLTGSALNYDESYPDQKNLEISDLGFPRIILNGNGKKDVTVIKGAL